MINTVHKFDIKINNISSAFDDIKKYIAKSRKSEFSMDLSSLNIIDATKILAVSSAYFYGKFPNGKIKYRHEVQEIDHLLSNFSIKNLELV